MSEKIFTAKEVIEFQIEILNKLKIIIAMFPKDFDYKKDEVEEVKT